VPTGMLLLKAIKEYPDRSMVHRGQEAPDPTYVHFHYARRFSTRVLAHMLDSLVRVSRRVVRNRPVERSKARGDGVSLHARGWKPRACGRNRLLEPHCGARRCEFLGLSRRQKTIPGQYATRRKAGSATFPRRSLGGGKKPTSTASADSARVKARAVRTAKTAKRDPAVPLACVAEGAFQF